MARVLLVDDEERILASLCRSLRREGYELVTARSPQEALRILEEQDFDAVLTDHKMPGMTGRPRGCCASRASGTGTPWCSA